MESLNSKRPRSRFALCALVLIVIALGLASRKYGATLPRFVSANAGDALWTVAAFLGLAWLWPAMPSLALGVGAFAISVGVECSQLLDVAWLNRVRATTPGKLLLGSGFIWIDFVRYFAGALAAAAFDWSVLKTCSRREARAEMQESGGASRNN